MKNDDLFCVLDHRGNIKDSVTSGLFYKDTRHISRCELAVDGKAPTFIDATLASDNTALHVSLSSDVPDASGRTSSVFIDRTIYLTKMALCERIDLRCSSNSMVTASIDINFDAEFSDIFEVRKNSIHGKRDQIRMRRSDRSISIECNGRDTVQRCARIEFDPAPREISKNSATYDARIQPGEKVSFYLRINCESVDDKLDASAFSDGLEKLRRDRQRKRDNAVRVSTKNEKFDAWLERSLADLDMLTTEKETGPYPYAGLPWFSAPFGRDGIITALQTLWMDPSIARGVLGFLAKTQARSVSRENDAEPGKILHEARQGELSNIGEVPFRRYYGSADATPLFVFLAGEYFRRTGDRPFISEIWPAIENALRWIDRYGDIDGDGFVEYQRMTERGLNNQGWRDSVDSVFHADGSLAQGRIALCEVQAYVYAAKCAAAEIAADLGDAGTAGKLADEANTLRSIFDDRFWSEELSFYALALDGDKRQCAVRTSNAGHILLTGIAPTERAQTVADTLCSQTFFSGWGIRTVADSETKFDPLSYHNGSVWPHDTSLIAMGLARYGFKEQVDTLFNAMLDATAYFEMRRLPELFSGATRENAGPVRFPHACAPQAWCAGVPFAFLGAILGIGFDASHRRVTFHKSRLPSFLDTVTLRGLGINEATADVTVRTDRDGVEVMVDNVQGDVEYTATDDPTVRISGLA